MIIIYGHKNGSREVIELPIPADVLEQIRNNHKLWPKPTVDRPDDEELEMEASDAVCTATDGCSSVEPDGICPHGHVSWLMYLGYY